ncbi:FAER331Cp [Eremothecium gossypii FDAG1]|nr:FAER331Cp [Eremothecium gossypii FDAG1]
MCRTAQMRGDHLDGLASQSRWEPKASTLPFVPEAQPVENMEQRSLSGLSSGSRRVYAKRRAERWALGLVLLGIVVVLWVLSSFLVNLLFEDATYRKPFLITYVNTAALSLYLVAPTVQLLWRRRRSGVWELDSFVTVREEGKDAQESALLSDGGEQTLLLLGDDARQRGCSDLSGKPVQISLWATAKLSAVFCVLWFVANFVTNASLGFTSVGSATILSSTSSFFTLLLGVLMKTESASVLKVLGSVVSSLGIVLVTKSDTGGAAPTVGASLEASSAISVLIGNILALAGALCYGIYLTLLKWRVRDESRINMQVFFGFVGLFTLVFLWPAIVLLHATGWEEFRLPPNGRILFIVLVNCLTTFISDYCWAKAVLLTSPLTVTMGLSATIPLAMLGDFLLKDRSMSFAYILGAILICGSFLVINNHSNAETTASERDPALCTQGA